MAPGVSAPQGGETVLGTESPKATETAPGAVAGTATAPQVLSPKQFTFYVPGAGGTEGGKGASLPGPDGKAIARTLADFLAGRSNYITIAAVNGRTPATKGNPKGTSQGEFLNTEKGKVINIPVDKGWQR